MLEIKKKSKDFIKNFLPLNLYFYDLDLDKNFHIMQGNRKSFFQETMKKMSLSELFILFRTDKAKIYENSIYSFEKKKYVKSLVVGHDYSKAYSFPDRKKIKNIIEIGSFYGSSSAAFAAYFYNAKIYCIDINFEKNFIKSSRIKKIVCDQSNQNKLIKFIKKYKLDKKIDFISDDGIHKYDYIIKSFVTLFPSLKKNGCYFIEDVTREGNPEIYNLFIKKKFRKLLSLNLANNIKKIVILKSNINYKTQSDSNETFIIKIFKI
jgi:tRNA G46 methylase TrmB